MLPKVWDLNIFLAEDQHMVSQKKKKKTKCENRSKVMGVFGAQKTKNRW